MHKISIHDAEKQLRDLVDEAARGEEVVIARGDGAASKLVPGPQHVFCDCLRVDGILIGIKERASLSYQDVWCYPSIQTSIRPMSRSSSRRDFLKSSAVVTAGLGAGLWTAGCGRSSAGESSAAAPAAGSIAPLYQISLAQWSLHRALFDGDLDNLDFARTAKEDFGIDAVEYVNQFFMDKATDQAYLQDMKQRAEEAGVRSLLIMCDGEGALGAPDEADRTQAVENHHKWVEAAQFLGCHSIRVNAETQEEGSFDEQMQRAADGLRQLCEFADDYDINVLVENHGGLSSNGEWLAGVMEETDHPRVGTLPDFGNFRISEEETYDRYQGVRELMPYAKAVSAKALNFNEQGEEVDIDFERMMRIVLEHDYHGYVGIEYEGSEGLGEREGIQATKDLLVRVREQLSSERAG
jgi:sugar phosphate isomerase/epimerase/antitoxin (DNA-binding transcriptional repressor) of toxin-antitoxin stability system